MHNFRFAIGQTVRISEVELQSFQGRELHPDESHVGRHASIIGRRHDVFEEGTEDEFEMDFYLVALHQSDEGDRMDWQADFDPAAVCLEMVEYELEHTS